MYDRFVASLMIRLFFFSNFYYLVRRTTNYFTNNIRFLDPRTTTMSAPGTGTRSSGGLSHFGSKVLEELGLISLWQTPPDAKLLCAQRFVRLFAYGGSTLILASYLSALGISDDRIGLFMTLTLTGDVVISFFLTLFADASGRRAVLALGSALMSVSGAIFALFGNYWVLLAAAVFGVISPRYETWIHIKTIPVTRNAIKAH